MSLEATVLEVGMLRARVRQGGVSPPSWRHAKMSWAASRRNTGEERDSKDWEVSQVNAEGPFRESKSQWWVVRRRVRGRKSSSSEISRQSC